MFSINAVPIGEFTASNIPFLIKEIPFLSKSSKLSYLLVFGFCFIIVGIIFFPSDILANHNRKL